MTKERSSWGQLISGIFEGAHHETSLDDVSITRCKSNVRALYTVMPVFFILAVLETTAKHSVSAVIAPQILCLASENLTYFMGV